MDDGPTWLGDRSSSQEQGRGKEASGLVEIRIGRIKFSRFPVIDAWAKAEDRPSVPPRHRFLATAAYEAMMRPGSKCRGFFDGERETLCL